MKKFLSIFKSRLTRAICLAMICSFTLSTVVSTKAATIPFIIISPYHKVIDIGEQFTVYALTSNGKLPSYKSSSSSIASVNTYGVVTAKKAGTALITAKISGAEASCKVTVNPTKISLSRTSASLECGQGFRLKATTSTGAEVTYSSSKSSVATVSDSGYVLAKKPGQANIKVKCQGTSVTCKVKVKVPTITLNETDVTMYRLRKCQLRATTSSGKAVTYRSNKSSVATVSSSGEITAVKHGSAIITATLDGASATCCVYVKQPTMSISPTALTLKPGKTKQLTVKISSGNIPEYSSSNPAIADITPNGLIKAYHPGKATIYCKEDGIKKSCIVTVTQPKK